MPADLSTLDKAFNPDVVVVFGDKKASGFMWLNSMKNFKGKLYSVQLDPNEISEIEKMGVPNFTSLADIPEPVDYAVCAVPRKVAPFVVADCVKHKVGAVTLFTAGFAETGTDEGRQAQAQILDMAQEGGLTLIGPNCMGLHNPEKGVCFFPGQPTYEGGMVGFASQSGSHGNSFSVAAPDNGLPISKMVSFGNGIILENADYLDYFSRDEQTKVIAMYVEGLRDGRRFFELLRQVTKKKPVVIWKGGQTDDGKRATASHTASLAESMNIWEAVAQQTGCALVDSLEEAIDTVKALAYLPPFTGEGCGLTGGAGGQSVSITDAFAKAGMKVPRLSEHSYRKLADFFSLVGASFSNPIDMGSNRAEIDTILDILIEDSVIEIVVMQMALTTMGRSRSAVDTQMEALIRLKERTKKPIVAVPVSPTPLEQASELKELNDKLIEAGIPYYPTYERAARALKNAVDCHRARAELI